MSEEQTVKAAEPQAAAAAVLVPEEARRGDGAAAGKPDGGEAKVGDGEKAGGAAENGGSQADANKVRVCLKALKNIERDLQNVIKLLDTQAGTSTEVQMQLSGISSPSNATREMELAGLRPVEGRVVEGVFDGSNMVGSDGKIYTVPANYASKSKLVEGDMLKLTITPKGSFIYKQIGPIERSRVVGTLGFDPTTGEYYAATENRRWSVIKASVTYFKGEPGDEVIMLVPKNTPSKWAAVENILKKSPLPAA